MKFKALKPYTIRSKSFICCLFILLVPKLLVAAENDLRDLTHPWSEEAELLVLVDGVDDRRLYLIGEASHGTREFYRIRNLLTQRLIENGAIQFVLVEGDWNSLQPLNGYVLGRDEAPPSAEAALQEIERWPLWMWANREMEEFGQWLREYNQDLPKEERIGIYGMDVYGMWDSLDFLVDFFHHNYPDEEEAVRDHYHYLLESRGDQSSYIQLARRDMNAAAAGPESVSALLVRKLQTATGQEQRRLWDAYQQAKVVEAGSAHLRAMTQSRALSWNYRARHFYDTAKRLLDLYGRESGGAVWAHNTHVGDARATSMAQQGQVNIGQLARMDLGEEAVYVIGFGTGTGTVLAAREWGDTGEIMTIPTPMEGSLEEILLQVGEGFPLWMRLDGERQSERRLRQIALPHRAIGVVYHPEREHMGNFVPSALASRYDAFIFLPETESLRPLDSLP